MDINAKCVKRCEFTDKRCEIIDKPQQGPRGFVKSNWKCKGPTCRDGHVQLHAAVVAGLVEVVQVLARYRMRRGETGPGLLGPPLAFGVRNIPLIPFHGLIKSEPGSCRGWSSMSSMLAPPPRRWKMSQRMRPDSRIRRSSVQDPSRPDQTPPQLSDELGVELWTSCQPQVSEATHPHPDRRRFCDRHHPRRAS